MRHYTKLLYKNYEVSIQTIYYVIFGGIFISVSFVSFLYFVDVYNKTMCFEALFHTANGKKNTLAIQNT